MGCPSLLESRLTCPQRIDILDYVGGYGPDLGAFDLKSDTTYPARTDKDGWWGIYESRLPENRGSTWGNCKYRMIHCMRLKVPRTGNEIELRSERNYPTEPWKELIDYHEIHNELIKRLYFSPEQFSPQTNDDGHCSKNSLEDLKSHIKKNSAICGCPVVCNGSSGIKHAIRFVCREHTKGCPFSFVLK